MTRLCYCFGFLFLLALLAGCGKNVGLKGKVTYSDDGSPVTAGTICFRKDGKIARGDIQEDGSFVVGFESEANGLPPGKYEVFFTGTDKVTTTVVGTRESMGVVQDIVDYQYEPQIAERYKSAETSQLTFEVNASTKNYDIQVDRYGQ
ncbi:MAG: hypothetical protein LBI05_06800 [Planctomycetaceae bacterium]|jgi:hypothetical protein|nr:hypothetical protein [Planctomycetaceae bacterium]